MNQIVLVCGGRAYDDRETLFTVLDATHSAHPITLLVHGGAHGADELAQEWADDRGVCCKVYPADWKKWGKAAGPKRNQIMLDAEKPHLVIAFPGGKGTSDMVIRAGTARVRVARVTRPIRIDTHQN